MSLARPLASPFYSGAGLSAEVPGKWDCALNGHTFMLDWKYAGQPQFSRHSISLLKPQQDTSGNVSESSLNPEEFARRAAESWHHGAGQTHLDRADSDPYRFRTSKGVDVWTKWGVSLLGDTTLKRTSVNTNLQVLAVGSYLYGADGNQVYSTTDMTTWTSRDVHDGEGAQSVKSIATDGATVYAALGSNGIHSGAAGVDFAHYSDLSCTLVGFVKGRLMAANGTAIYNVIAAGAAPSALLTLGTGFTWVGFAEGPAAIYAAGYRGDKSLVYRTSVKADGTALDVPVVAGELPDGEIVRSIQGYLGYLLVGTDKGLRLLTLDVNGDIAGSGRIIPTSSAVLCMEPQDRFVWYGLTNYDTASTGLGRADLGTFTDTLTPAYASDLMATTSGAVLSVATFGALRVFAVSAAGFFAESTDKVTSGTVESGMVSYGLPDTKVAITLDARFEPLDGAVTVALSADGGDYTTLGSDSTADTTSLTVPAGETRAETFEVRLTLTRAATTTLGPVATRWTLESNPAPGRGEFLDLPLRLFENVKTAAGTTEAVDVAAEYAALMSMEALGAPIIHQDGLGSSIVFLDDHDFLTDSYTTRRDAFNGTFVARLRRPRRRS